MLDLRVILLTVLLLASGPVSAGAQRHSVDAASGAHTWETQVGGVTVSLTQILSDQARAFYVNRGFGSDAIEAYATSCVFMTVLRNDAADGVAHYRLRDWQVNAGGDSRPPLSTADWIARLQEHEPGQGPLIAFRWAQFPPEQSYQPGGDWNQGMLSVGLPIGERFDLVARWTVNNKVYEGLLNDVVCPD